MNPLPKRVRTDPELKLRTDFVELLRRRSWFVHITHGNVYSKGLPDLYCAHINFGVRWIEVKNADNYHFTPAQLVTFPQMTAKNVGIWVVALRLNYTERELLYEYENVVCYGPPNWSKYMGHSKRPY